MQRFRVVAFFVLACLALTPAYRQTHAKNPDATGSDVDPTYRRRYTSSNDIYIGVGFGVTGAGLKTSSGDVISNGFIANNPLLGTELRIGFQHAGKILYFALEFTGAAYFAINDGPIGSSGGESVTVVGPGKGVFSVGFNIKPGISFNQRRGSIYLIAGAVYSWFSGSYSDSTNPMQTFSMDGFGLNYGIGMKHNLNDFTAVFLEFHGLAPIRGSGAFGLDRTPVSNGVEFTKISALETYTLLIGLDILM